MPPLTKKQIASKFLDEVPRALYLSLDDTFAATLEQHADVFLFRDRTSNRQLLILALDEGDRVTVYRLDREAEALERTSYGARGGATLTRRSSPNPHGSGLIIEYVLEHPIFAEIGAIELQSAARDAERVASKLERIVGGALR
jgi:hypothetical protein